MVPKQCTAALTTTTNAQKQRKSGKPTTEGNSHGSDETTTRALTGAQSTGIYSVDGIKGAKVTLGVSVLSMEVAAAVPGAGAVREPDEAVVAEHERRLQQEHLREIRRLTVFFTVGTRHEEALFYTNTPAEQIKDLFRAAAEASPRDILKLYNRSGQLLNINAGLEPNTPSTRYAVQVVAAHSCAMLEERAAIQLQTLETRIADIERQLKADPPLPDAVRQLQRQVDAFRDKLETTESLSWLGFNKQLPMPVSTEECRRLKYRRKSDSIKKQVKMNFANICDSQVSDLVREDLRMPSFDSTQWEDEELLWLLQQMYLDFDLCIKFAIDIDTLRNFLYEAYKNYNEVPFHNFRHCFCVAQMMYAISWAVDLPSKIGELEVLILLTSCICHDLDHPGYNNIYQINAKTELALRYNDISPLENHHCSVAFRILENEDCNLFKSFTSDSFKVIREGIIRSILATDMARHNEILSQFKETIVAFDYENRHHVNLLCMVLIKVSDISNEARPMDVAEPWLDKLLMEFFKQSDAEKLEGLPVTPFMDRDRITKPSSQCSFIGFVLLPLFETLAELLTELQDLIVQPVRDALDYYRRLNEATKEERHQRKSIVAELSLGGDLSPAQSTGSSQGLCKSGSNLRLKKSLSFQTNRSRSRSSDTDDMSNQLDQGMISPTTLSAPASSIGASGDDPPSSSLCLVAEDDNEHMLDSEEEEDADEDSETNTVTEVEASEKALKFKISTDATSSSFSGMSLLGSNSGGRKSYPGSRKGSRERVIISSGNQAALQQQQQSMYQPNYRAPAKLQKTIGTLSFDHQYVTAGPTAATTSLALDRRGGTSVIAAVTIGSSTGGDGGSGVGLNSAKAGNNVSNSPSAVVVHSTQGTSSPSPTKKVVPTLSPPPPPKIIPTTHIKRTTNFLLKTLKHQNSSKGNNKSNSLEKTNTKLRHSKDFNDDAMVNVPLDQEEDQLHSDSRNVDPGHQQQTAVVCDIRNSLDSNLKVNSEDVHAKRDQSKDRLCQRQQEKQLLKLSSNCQQQKYHQIGGSSSPSTSTAGSFLSRIKHFTYDRLGLLSSTGNLDKDDKCFDDAGQAQRHRDTDDNIGRAKTATLKSNSSSASRMTLPLIYRRKHRHQQQGSTTSTTCCKSLDNVEMRQATATVPEEPPPPTTSSSSSRLHNNKASTLPKARKLGDFGSKRRHWKMFLLGGGFGGGTKRGSAAAAVAKEEEVGGGEKIKAGGWSSDCDVTATAATKAEDIAGDDNDSQKSCPPSTSQHTNVTLLKNNKVTTTTIGIGGGGGGEDVQCCRTRLTKFPPLPPTTVVPISSRGGGNTVAVVTAQPQQQINNSADIVTM